MPKVSNNPFVLSGGVTLSLPRRIARKIGDISRSISLGSEKTIGVWAQVAKVSKRSLSVSGGVTVRDPRSFFRSRKTESSKSNQIVSCAESVASPIVSSTKIEETSLSDTRFSSLAITSSFYVDMGIFQTQVLNQAITWYTPDFPNGCFKTADLNKYLDEMFTPFSQDGISEINLSFAQIANIAAILNKDKSVPADSDTILQILESFDVPVVDENGEVLTTDVIGYMISYANSKGIKVDLAFGGAIASLDDYKIDDPIQAANNLLALMKKYNLQDVEFDIENVTALMANGEEKVLTFFKTLHSALKQEGEDKKVFLTLIGDIAQGPKEGLKPIFDNFNACADGVRLMMYDGGTHFYIDANNPGYGIKAWLDILNGGVSKISIGFFNTVPYSNPQSSDPDYTSTKYEGFPSGASNGQAAGWIYKRVLSQLGLKPSQFGFPFFWRTKPVAESYQFEEDFEKEINQ